MEFRILGPLEARAGSVEVTPTSTKQRTLLALLVLRAGEVMPSDRLIEELWGAHAPDSARNALQVHVSQLRRVLGPGGDVIVTRPGGYALDVDAEDVDAVRFERLLTQGREALELGSHEAASRSLRSALGLWRGEALSDLRYEPFAQAEATRLEGLRLAALEGRIEADLALGRHADCVAELEALIAREPLRERLREQLMLALYRSGRQADALAAFRSARETLVEEVGIEPGTGLRELERRMLAQDPTLHAQGVAEAENPGGFGGPAVPATRFVGRERELAELSDLVRNERFVSMRGPGGAGKTRLALRAAERLASEFTHGVCFVELATVRTLPEVWRAVSAGLEAHDADDSYADAAIKSVAGQHALLVLDNCEHVLDGAREVAETLLAGSLRLHILATTREALGSGAEEVWPIPDMGEDAVALFAERAARALPGHTITKGEVAVVERICSRLDRLPLAIELAAARMSVLAVEQIDERLSERFRLLSRSPLPAPDRHRTLRAAVSWSYDLLTEPQRLVLATMSVFRGGLDIEAAEQVLAAGIIEEQGVLDLLAELVEKSLVARLHEGGVAARYGLHDTIRQYAAERLCELGLASDAYARHAEYFLDLAEQSREHLDDSSPEWVDRLEREHDNLRSAFEHFEAIGDRECRLQLAGAMSGFWDYGGHLREGTERVAAALAADARPTAIRARALTGGSALAALSGDPVTARHWAEEGLSLHRELGDSAGVAQALWAIGYAIAENGDPATAAPYLEESVQAFRELNDDPSALSVTRTLAWTYHDLGDLARSRLLHEENLDHARASGHQRLEARSLGSLANIAVDDGRAEEALPMLRRAYQLDRDLGDRLEMSLDLCRLAKALAAQGDGRTAARLLGSFEATARVSGAAVPWVTRMNARTLGSICAQLGGPGTDEELGVGLAMSADDAMALALKSIGGEQLR